MPRADALTLLKLDRSSVWRSSKRLLCANVNIPWKSPVPILEIRILGATTSAQSNTAQSLSSIEMGGWKCAREEKSPVTMQCYFYFFSVAPQQRSFRDTAAVGMKMYSQSHLYLRRYLHLYPASSMEDLTISIRFH